MREVTRVITVEITDIMHLDDDEVMITDTPEWRTMVEGLLKDLVDADNISIINVQDFERDMEDCKE